MNHIWRRALVAAREHVDTIHLEKDQEATL